MRQHSVRFDALGSTAVVAVDDHVRLNAAREVAERVIGQFDVACSRFREDSELSAVNRAAGTAVRVGPVLLDAVQAALRAARLTDGDVDPTVGQAVIALGYDRDFAALEARPSRKRVSVATVPGWQAVTVDPSGGTVRLARGVKLDLGATAKALAADRAAAHASREAGCGVLVSLGGDIAVAGPPPDDSWLVRITDDHRAGVDAPGQWITVRDGGVATSSTTTRRWTLIAGATAHHLIDPRTGSPAVGLWRTTTVAAGSCLDANIASTAAIVRGQRAIAWLQLLELPSRLVSIDGRVLHLGGWPSEADDLAAIVDVPEVVA